METEEQGTIARVREFARVAPGAIRKNVGLYAFMALVSIFMLVVWLSAGTPQAAPPRKNTQPDSTPFHIKQTEIDSFGTSQQREAEKARADRARAETAGKQDPGEPNLVQGNPPPVQQAAAQAPPDPVAEDRKKVRYLSLRGSNLVDLDGTGKPDVEGDAKTSQAHDDAVPQNEVQQLLALMAGAQAGGYPPASLPVMAPGKSQGGRQESAPANPYVGVPGEDNRATGKFYRLPEGTTIDCALLFELTGETGGPADCVTTDDTWSHSRNHLLIPTGSKFLGEATKTASFGQSRVAISFHRVIMPDGFSISLDQFHGLNQEGSTGLTADSINHHYLAIWGPTVAVGILGALAQGTSGNILTQGGWGRVQQGIGEGTDQAAMRVLDRLTNIYPTIKIKQGHRLKVYLSGDLLIPSYDAHTMDADQ